MTIQERVKNTPLTAWPVADNQLSGAGKFFGLYGGEHIAATEFVIGATLAQYGCSAKDLLIGLFIGNCLATLMFALICAPLGVETRQTLYTFLGRIFGETGQKIYNIVFGIGFAAIAALGLSVSATAIRRILNVPTQHEWYPTSIGFVIIVIVLGAVVTLVAANGFDGVTAFATRCVPWMICLFAMGFVCVLPEIAKATNYGSINSIVDVYNILDTKIWTGAVPAGGTRLGLPHVIAFACVCNLAVHLGLNDMSVFRFAKRKEYGFISAMGMFVGHYFAWVAAGIMGATAAILLNTDLSLLDSGDVTMAVLGYAGLLAVVIAGWTTANPTIYRVALSFNSVFPKASYKQMTYVMGTIITVVACFPAIQNGSTVINWCGLLVLGVGAICAADYYIFPKIGYTRYWNLYKGNKVNPAAIIAWICSLAFFVTMIATNAIQQNFWFIFVYCIAGIVYIVLAGFMGAKDKYPEKEREEMDYEAAMQQYANEHAEPGHNAKATGIVAILNFLRFLPLAGMFFVGFMFWSGVITDAAMKSGEMVATAIYFVIVIAASIIEAVQSREKVEQSSTAKAALE